MASPGLCLSHWDGTLLNVEASKDLKELRGQKEGDGWTRPLPLSLFSPISGDTRIPARAGPWLSPPCLLRAQNSTLCPTNYSSQRLDSIFRTWDVFSRRKGCEILGRQLQAPPAPAGVLIRILQEDRLWINCPKVKIILALSKWLRGRR